MKVSPPTDDDRRRVWMAFAEHFLDTETRYLLPRAALAAVEAGLTVEDARRIWRYEVTPAVGGNLLSVAGEWGGWDEEWLVATVAEVARRKGRLASAGSYLFYRFLTLLFGDTTWRAIERLMGALLAVDSGARQGLARDLEALAQHYFAFAPPDLGLVEPGRKEALRRLYVEVFLPSFRATVVRAAGESGVALEGRVEEVLR